ncbi:GIY-YIG nuclease family protein [Enterococcus sp. CWB-B31]|uniref:GIY-YIG nuclease family protein n=1 Tax=Enterococcus sp. CWB-B31 TaxID=2885159 RepID=UPI001E38E0F9|nr:GIY-YIG nuclease family protein [Enterococcus sp. CWB-B31]MCB5955813.1 GIY-YIG nuclease family protein [Enterococcus sp. CWB-B31]
MNEQLKKEAKKLPLSPGVYLMKDKSGTIIYIGKAKKLKERVSSYFIKNNQHSNKVKRMLVQLSSFDVIHVDTELDALLLECRLIQHYRPMYNRQMNAFERYSYLEIHEGETSIRLHKSPYPEAKYSFGPYAGYQKIPEVIAILEKLYQLNPNDAWQRLFHRSDETKPLKYLVLKELLQAFSGDSQDIEKRIEEKMLEASEQMQFIQAARWRDDRKFIRTFFYKNKQLLLSPINQKEWHALWLPMDHTVKCYLIYQGLIVTEKVFPEKITSSSQNMQQAAQTLLLNITEYPDSLSTYSKKQIDFVAILHLYLKRIEEYQLFPIEKE